MEASELLNLQTSASTADSGESTSESENVTKYVTIEDTPFTTVIQDDSWIVVMGNYQVSSCKFKNSKDAVKYVKSKPWELILLATAAFTEITNEQKQLNKTTV